MSPATKCANCDKRISVDGAHRLYLPVASMHLTRRVLSCGSRRDRRAQEGGGRGAFKSDFRKLTPGDTARGE
jgi:hypothetical protein